MRGRSFDLTERMIFLRAIPVAALLPPSVLKVVAAQLAPSRVESGTLLVKKGDPIGALHLLIEGKVRMQIGVQSLGELAPPQSVGFLGILGGVDASYDAIAVSDVESLALDARVLLELIEEHTELMQATCRYLCERIYAELQDMPVEALQSRLDGQDLALGAAPLSMVERILWFRTLAFFKRTNLNSIAALTRSMVERRLPAGTEIWRTGDHEDYTVNILAGRARCERSDGKVWRAGPTAVLGGADIIAQKPRWYRLVADTDLAYLEQPLAAFSDLLEDDFAVASAFFGGLARDLAGILTKRALSDATHLSTPRDVSGLGSVAVGA